MAAETGSEAERIDCARPMLVAILAERASGYIGAGIQAVAPYQLGPNTDADVALEMREDAEAITELTQPLTVFHDAWLGRPHPVSAEVGDAYFWMTLDIDDRPVVTLSHQLYMAKGGVEAVGIRDFYLTSFFDVGQSIALLMPVEDGILLVTAARVWVDDWSGAPHLKHAVGTNMLAKQMRHLVEDEKICGSR